MMDHTGVPTEEELETARRIFAGTATFVAGSTTPDALPPEALPEFAFAGRSNVGKSSLLNALTHRKHLARASKTPGRTQQINFFNLADRLYLVDLPGYGHAAASQEKAAAWTGLIRVYLKHRTALRTVCLLVDARHGLKDTDRGALAYLAECGRSAFVVLTKADKVKPAELAACQDAMTAELRRMRLSYPIFPTSSDTGAGLPALRAALIAATLDSAP